MTRPASSVRGYELLLFVLLAALSVMLDDRIERLEHRIDTIENNQTVEGTSTPPVRYQP